MTDLKAIVNTKSNIYNANGISLQIIQFIGTLVICEVDCYGKYNKNGQPSSKSIHADFNIKEIIEICEC